jgi:PEP-CTERM motif
VPEPNVLMLMLAGLVILGVGYSMRNSSFAQCAT